MIEVPYKCNDSTCAANTLIKTPKYGILKCITTDRFLLLLHKIKLGFQSLVLNVWNVCSPPPPGKKKGFLQIHLFTNTTTS